MLNFDSMDDSNSLLERSQFLISELALKSNLPDDAVVCSRSADFFVIQSSAGRGGTKPSPALLMVSRTPVSSGLVQSRW